MLASYCLGVVCQVTVIRFSLHLSLESLNYTNGHSRHISIYDIWTFYQRNKHNVNTDLYAPGNVIPGNQLPSEMRTCQTFE